MALSKYPLGGAEGFPVFAGPYVAVGMSGSGLFKTNIQSDDPDAVAVGAVGTCPGSKNYHRVFQLSPNYFLSSK